MICRPEVQRFAEAMEAQLCRNDHKPGWQGEDLFSLFQRLLEEAGELSRAMALYISLSYCSGEAANEQRSIIVKEAADVANFAMMIADAFLRKEEHGPT